jgi:hypothetical protein
MPMGGGKLLGEGGDSLVPSVLVNQIRIHRGVVVASGADHPTPVAQRNIVAHHAHGVVDLEAQERCGLRQRASLGGLP